MGVLDSRKCPALACRPALFICGASNDRGPGLMPAPRASTVRRKRPRADWWMYRLTSVYGPSGVGWSGVARAASDPWVSRFVVGGRGAKFAEANGGCPISLGSGGGVLAPEAAEVIEPIGGCPDLPLRHSQVSSPAATSSMERRRLLGRIHWRSTSANHDGFDKSSRAYSLYSRIPCLTES